jgi:hypothetical protein
MLVENLNCENLHFLSNHASNYVSIDASLPKEKDAVIKTLEAAINHEIPVRGEIYRGL